MHPSAWLLIELRVHPVVHPGQLQRRLAVAVDALHLRMEHSLQRRLPTWRPTVELAIANTYIIRYI